MNNENELQFPTLIIFMPRNICIYYQIQKVDRLVPSIAHLHIYLNELKFFIHSKTCTWMSIAALLIIAKAWKHQDVQ